VYVKYRCNQCRRATFECFATSAGCFPGPVRHCDFTNTPAGLPLSPRRIVMPLRERDRPQREREREREIRDPRTDGWIVEEVKVRDYYACIYLRRLFLGEPTIRRLPESSADGTGRLRSRSPADPAIGVTVSDFYPMTSRCYSVAALRIELPFPERSLNKERAIASWSTG